MSRLPKNDISLTFERGDDALTVSFNPLLESAVDIVIEDKARSVCASFSLMPHELRHLAQHLISAGEMIDLMEPVRRRRAEEAGHD